MWISCKDAAKRSGPSHQSCIRPQLASSAILCCPLTTLTICCILTLFSCSRLSYLSESLPDPLALSSSQLSHFRSERQCAASLSQLRQRLDPRTSVVVVAGRCEAPLAIGATAKRYRCTQIASQGIHAAKPACHRIFASQAA